MSKLDQNALPPGASDFDFLHGAWDVHHRRLRERLVGSEDWQEFRGSMVAEPILGGLGNFDRNVIELPSDRYEACTLRLFDPLTSLWSLRWIDGRNPRVDPPVVGGFADGTGAFFGEDSLDGRPIRVRFSWSDMTDSSARWQQAFSGDGGIHWETNWVMVFQRVTPAS